MSPAAARLVIEGDVTDSDSLEAVAPLARRKRAPRLQLGTALWSASGSPVRSRDIPAHWGS